MQLGPMLDLSIGCFMIKDIILVKNN